MLFDLCDIEAGFSRDAADQTVRKYLAASVGVPEIY